MTVSLAGGCVVANRRPLRQQRRLGSHTTQFAAVSGGDSTWSTTKAVPWQDVVAGPTLLAVVLPLVTCAHSTHGSLSVMDQTQLSAS